jgi:uncharacterized protein (TIGR03067 family)
MTVIACLAIGRARGGDEDAFKGLPGTWVVESAKRDGKATEHKGSEITFSKEGEMKVKPAKGEEEKYLGEFDLCQKPVGIAFRGTRKGSEFGRGIIELKGDTLKLCLVPWGKTEPPTKFTDQGALLLILKRKK